MILFLAIAFVSLLLQLFLPWWSLAIAAFACSFFLGKRAAASFSAGLLGCGLVWLLMALYVHFTKGDIMTDRIAMLLNLPSSWILFASVFLISGIVGGLAALSGYYLKAILRPGNPVSVA